MQLTQQDVGRAVRCIWATLFCAALSLSGCGTRRTNADYIPSPRASHEALSIVLDAWKAGQPAGPVAGSSPVVHMTDSSRVSGQILDEYEILGNVPSNAPCCLAVKLKLSNPTEVKRERYVIVGIDPLWIFRHEDYDMLLHWEHQMAAEPDKVSDSAAGDSDSLDAEASSDTKR